MKTKERSKEKVEISCGGNWSCLKDIVRSSVAVDHYKDLARVVTELQKSGIKLARKPKDRFVSPTGAGYRDVLLNVTYSNGHIGELQLHVKPMLTAKIQGHRFYEKVRSIEEKAEKAGGETISKEEMAIVEDANREMMALYDKAWKKAFGGSNEGKTAAGKTKHFEYDGNPAEWTWGKFPVMRVGNKKVTVYDIEKFFREASPISESQFKKS